MIVGKFAVIRFFRRLWRAAQFARLGYNDNDWCFESIYPILAFKLEKLRKALEEDQRYLRSDQRAKEVEYAEKLLRRIRFHDYYTNKNDPFCTCPDEVMEVKESGEIILHFCKSCQRDRIPYVHKREKADLQAFYGYLAKHGQKWWT